MAQRNNCTVVSVTADTTTSPPTLGVKYNYPGDPNANPPVPAEEGLLLTAVPQAHYDNFLKALGTNLKVDVGTDAMNNCTTTTVHA